MEYLRPDTTSSLPLTRNHSDSRRTSTHHMRPCKFMLKLILLDNQENRFQIKFDLPFTANFYHYSNASDQRWRLNNTGHNIPNYVPEHCPSWSTLFPTLLSSSSSIVFIILRRMKAIANLNSWRCTRMFVARFPSSNSAPCLFNFIFTAF